MTIPIISALFHNDFLFASHQLVLFSNQICLQNPKLHFLDLVPLFIETSKSILNQQIDERKKELREEISSCNKFENLNENKNFESVSKAVKRMVNSMDILSRGWKEILPEKLLFSFECDLTTLLIQEVIGEMEKINSIAESECGPLSKICAQIINDIRNLLSQFQLKIEEKAEKSLNKMKLLSEVFHMRMVDIVESFSKGEMEGFSTQEVASLITALFKESRLKEEQIEKLLLL